MTPKSALKLVPPDSTRAATLTAFPPLTVAPPPPKWLTGDEAQREWGRLAPALVAARLLHAGNVAMLAQLCALHASLAHALSWEREPNLSLLNTYRSLAKALGLLAKATAK